MRSDSEVVDVLNELWTVKRALIDQNVARSKVCEARDQQEFADRFSKIAFGHMREVASLLDRIVAVGGMPRLLTVNEVPVGETLSEQIRLSLDAEHATTERYKEALTVCEQDEETRGLVSAALENQRAHIDWLESAVSRSP